MTNPAEAESNRVRPAPGRVGRPGAALLAVMALALASCANTRVDFSATTTTMPGSHASSGPVVVQHPGTISLGRLPASPVAADAHARPIVLAMINQEDVELGSFPEVRQGAEAAVDLINHELGGVGGRPIELVPCRANFTPEKSQKCAQQAVERGAVAVVGGLDIMSSSSVPVLEAAGVPYVGGIPVNFEEMRSPVSFQFSGGSPGQFAGFAHDMATRLDAEKVSLAYAEYPPIKGAALDYGAATLRSLGVTDITEVGFPIVTSDYAPVVAKAFAHDPDAVVMGVTDKACVDVMKLATRHRGQLYLSGACAAPNTTRAAGDAAEGVIFNVEGPLRPAEAGNDFAVYRAAMHRYAPATPAESAATVSFRAVMNLWSVMGEIGPASVSPAAVTAAFRAAKDHPSFTGHPFTCDGRQVPDLPALCSPQQILVRYHDGELHQITDWVDVPAIVDAQG